MKDLLAAIEGQEALASRRGNLQEERLEALDHYLGRPYGDEVEGRSAVVMRDVADTIEWIKPSLLEVFCSGDEVCRFDPVNAQDEPQAEQETDYVNHVVMQVNNGFLVFHDWFHDALLQKNGYVMVQAVKEKVANRDQYQGLTDDEFALLAQNKSVEIVEHTAYQDPVMGTCHNVVIRKHAERKWVKLTNIPPERALVAADWPGISLKGCPFFQVIEYRTISDLRQDGYDVPDTLSDTGDNDQDKWAEQRRKVDFDGAVDRSSVEADPPTRRLRVRYTWINWDSDGDGIAELRRVVVVGKTILEDEEDDLIPVACLTPMRQPHEHYGQSYDDIVDDIQRIHTVLMRGYLDNMYLANNIQFAVDADRVNLDDMLQNRPGGMKRVKGPVTDAITPLIAPPIGDSILQAMEAVDQVKETRTGVNKNTQGLDANVLEKTAQEARQLMSAAQLRIKMVARMFAETGVKDLMLIVHAVTMKSGREPEIVKLRNQWVPVDPSTWKSRYNMTVTVGLGTGNRDQQSAFLMQALQVQKEALMAGAPFVTVENVYNTAKRLTQNAGFKNTDEFWTDPKTVPPQPPQPHPEVIKAQAQAQGQAQVEQIKGQTAAQLAQIEAQKTIEVERAKAQLKAQTDAAAQAAQERQITAQQQNELALEQHKASLNAQTEQQRLQQQREIELARMAHQAAEGDKDRATKVLIAQIAAQTATSNAALAAQDKSDQDVAEE